jgi:hypothetical protein
VSPSDTKLYPTASGARGPFQRRSDPHGPLAMTVAVVDEPGCEADGGVGDAVQGLRASRHQLGVGDVPVGKDEVLDRAVDRPEIWHDETLPGVVWMRGAVSEYRIDPVDEYIIGIVTGATSYHLHRRDQTRSVRHGELVVLDPAHPPQRHTDRGRALAGATRGAPGSADVVNTRRLP